MQANVIAALTGTINLDFINIQPQQNVEETIALGQIKDAEHNPLDFFIVFKSRLKDN